MRKDIKEIIKAVINNKKNLSKDLAVLINGKEKIKQNLYFGKNLTVELNVFFDTSEGIILINDNTKVKAGSILRGPLLIGKNCVINNNTILSSSRIGDVCKLGGEIENVIMRDYSNKQHYGYLGHSYIGSWVNLGGGTSTATLKNTYTNVKINGIDTGTQFFGCIIGDYVKTAVNTSIFCGKVIEESSHLYGLITEDVPAFVSYLGKNNLYEMPLKLAKQIQERMSIRREVKFTDKDSKKFDELFKSSANDRKKLKVKKGKLKFK